MIQKAVADRLLETLTDEEILEKVRSGEVYLYELVMRRYNERVFRAARSILRNDDEAEDAVQETFVRAFRSLAQFEGRARFSTWLLRIAVNESLARKKKSLRLVSLDTPSEDAGAPIMEQLPSFSPNAEDEAARGELQAILTRAVDALPENLRLVFTLRDIQRLSTEETAGVLEISEANVKVRLHRARQELRKYFEGVVGTEALRLYAFDLRRCDRIVERVFERISS